MGEDISLQKALIEYQQIYVASRNFAERTRIEYLNDIRDLIRFLRGLGVSKVQEIGLPQLERYLAELDHRGVAPSTRKRKVIAIRSFLWYLYQDNYITTNISKRLIPPLMEPRKPRYLRKAEYERLLEAASNNARDFALIQLLLQTGIKLSEVTQLTTSDVELPGTASLDEKDSSYLHIRGGKSREARILMLNYKASWSLDTYLKARPSTETSCLFINRFGKPLGERGVEKIISKYLKRSGVANASVQSLRHTFGAYYAAKGATLKTLQKVMGYKDLKSGMKYVSLAGEPNREMKNKILE